MTLTSTPTRELTTLCSTVRGADRPVWICEGALSLVTTICSFHRDSPYKRECGRQNYRRPSSKPTASAPHVRRHMPLQNLEFTGLAHNFPIDPAV